jgi:MFS superfamily sulfate permease-like transporter
MQNYLSNLKRDLPAGVVVFLVALPLCLGIALASGAPEFSGIIAGVVGGIVIGSLSGSHLSVSGPAAGLTVIVLSAITKLGTFETFLLAVVIAGILQLAMGYAKLGVIGHFFPSAVIKGMLSAIGIILILKQIPHALGDDKDYEGDETFFQVDGENTFSEIIMAVQHAELGAIVIFAIAMAIMMLWDKPFMSKMLWTRFIPGPLVSVVAGLGLNEYFRTNMTSLYLTKDHLVKLPVTESIQEITASLSHPDFSQLLNTDVYVVALTIAIVASLESLLSLDATDKLDPHKRIAPPNRELKAQGVGNIVSGMLGGLPVTAVIVRSSANVNSGGQTKVSAIFHGILLLSSVLFLEDILNKIPLSALAAVLILVGYKLAKPSLFKEMFAKGRDQYSPFLITILAILFTNLLTGIGIGLVAGMWFVVKTNLHQAIEVANEGNQWTVTMLKDVSFLNKATLRSSLLKIPEGAHVVFDGSKAAWVDKDIVETITDFVKSAPDNGITAEIKKSKTSKIPIFAE